jgi:enhancing lycopene biosynthesis protein 2
LGHTHQATTISEIAIDATHKIISAPCYMMEGDIVAVNQNVKQAITALMTMI